MKEWIGTRELAERWGLSRQRIEQMRQAGLFLWKFNSNGHVELLMDRILELELYRNGKATRYPFSTKERIDCMSPIEQPDYWSKNDTR